MYPSTGLTGTTVGAANGAVSRALWVLVLAASGSLAASPARAGTVHFFNSSWEATLVASGTTSDTIRSSGYLFTYTRDKLFTGGLGHPIGRPVRVPWPQGVEGQAVTTGPNPSGAQIAIRRVDGRPFDLTALTARLLANTAATGASFEIMPKLNGEDAWNDPLYFDASGYYGSAFSYDEQGGFLGNTSLLKNFESYQISLFVDFAFTGLTLVAPGPPPLVGDANGDCGVGAADYAIWAAQFGQSGAELASDFDSNGSIGAGDYALWAANFGQTCPTGTTVPEPRCLPLGVWGATLVGCALAVRRRGER